jgi:FKBP-type peptidyl-prolyl cis-trans isomerase
MKNIRSILLLLTAILIAAPAFAQEKTKEEKKAAKEKSKRRKKLAKGYKKTAQGLYYKFYKQDPKGVKPKVDDFVTINMLYKDEKDTVIFDSKMIGEKMEFPLSASTFKGSFEDALMMMAEGDSASFLINGDSLYLKTFALEELPQGIEPGSLLRFFVKLQDVRTREEVEKEQTELYMQEMAKLEQRKFAEPGEIAEYLKNNNITTAPTASGLYYVETVKGKGPKPEAGDTVRVHYTGRFLDGKVFDSSLDTEPIEFNVGIGMVIPGWDEGIQMMNEGGKAKLIIPSNLAYGEGGVGDGLIPPYTPLVFEVELVKVK